jgi:HSP20 family molecular chaperone IbpA
MSRLSVFSSPLMLGFEPLAQLLEQATKAGDGYPPYNIERLVDAHTQNERWRLSLAVAGFSTGNLEVSLEGKQLIIRGHAKADEERDFLHRGIAGRSFARHFLVADDMEVDGATLENGMLIIAMKRRPLERLTQHIPILEA